MAKAILKTVMLCMLLAACGGGGSGNRSSNGGPVLTIDGACKTEYLTAKCTCADQNNIPGVQTCTGGMWSSCVCVAPAASGAGIGGGVGDAGVVAQPDGGQGVIADPPGNSSATRFAWKRTPFDIGICKAGHYVGTFMGFYGSPAAFGAPVPVAATDGADGTPGLEFTLEKMPGSGEIFAIKGGKMRGTADGLFPFTADLTGTLDCETKKYVGTIENGVYTVFGTDYHFVGTMTADYDKIQNEFINGIWHCTEPPNTTVPPGGDGQWNTKWKAM
jgi:hypothetical protein